MPFHPMWLPPPWWAEFSTGDDRAGLVGAVGECLQDDGGFGNWPNSTSYLECCFQAFVALNTLDSVMEFDSVAVKRFLAERAAESGGFADVPSGRSTLFNTFYGVICCNMLDMELPYGSRHADFVSEFRACEEPQHWDAYACEPGWRPELIATYWAVATLSILDATSIDLGSVGNFVDACWNDSLGAFGARPGHGAYLEYTYCALAIGSLLDLPLATDRRDRVVEFIAESLDEDTGLFGESTGAPGTLGDSLWAAACLGILEAQDAIDLRRHRQAIDTLEPNQLWHLHCKLLIKSYLDQASLRLSEKVLVAEHVPVPDGYAFVARDMSNAGSLSTSPYLHLDIADSSLGEIDGLLDELDVTMQSHRRSAINKFNHALEQLSREVTAAFMPAVTTIDLSVGHSFVELMSEPALLSVPLELAMVNEKHLGESAAVGRLVRAPAPADRDIEGPAASRDIHVLLLGGSHVGRRSNLPSVSKEIEAIGAMLQRVPRATVTCLDGKALTRKALRETMTNSGAAWDLIHFAGHSFAATGGADNDYARSGIILADGEIELRVLLEWCDGQTPPLVVINSCASSRTKLQREGVARLANRGMAAAVSLAGGAYIGAYWPMRDNPSTSFARTLFDLASRGLPIGEAVRLARMRLRVLGAPPSDWAGYCLVGSPRMRIAPYQWRQPLQGSG